MNYLNIILITTIAGVVGTGIGGALGAILHKDSNKIVSLLLSFAGGVMLSVVCFDLMTSSFAEASVEANNISSLLIVIGSVAFGYFIIWLLNYFIDKVTNKEIEHINESHPKTADDLDELIHSDHFEEHRKTNQNLFIAGIIMMSAIALHNLPEGMVIGASYAKDQTQTLFTSTGFIMALIIGLHNIPEGMAVSVPLVSGGMKKFKATLLTALSGIPTVIGAVIGYAVGGLSPIASTISLGFASGAMLYVIFGELLPEAILMWKSKLPALAAFIGILVGFAVVIL